MCQDSPTLDTDAWRAVRQRTGVYPCLSPCDGCKTVKGVMMWLAENIQACLRDFQTGTASMARKRHLVSSARGLLCFCLMTLVTTGLIRSIRLIRGRNKPILRRTALQAAVLSIGLSWHTSSVGVPGYSWYCPPGSIALCEAPVLWMVSYYGHVFPMQGKMVYSCLSPWRGW